jgi:uncharacterized damage-inducible protein DinB
MPSTVHNATILQLIPMVEQLTQQFTAQINVLSPTQLNWKPNATDWSVGQCLDHVITANQTYFPQLDQILAGARPTRFWERLPLAPTLFARLLIASLNPDRRYSMRTAKVFEPTLSRVEPEILATFTQHQQQLIERMQACTRLDAARIIITSPAASFVTYSLLDAFRILVVHEQHHLAQITTIRALREFPRQFE